MMTVFGFQLDIDVIDDSEAVTADSTAEMPHDDDGDDDDDDVPELASFRLQVSTNHNCLS